MTPKPGEFGIVYHHARDAGLIARMTGNEAKVYMLMLTDAYGGVVNTPYIVLAKWFCNTDDPSEAQVRNVRKAVSGLLALGAIRRRKRGVGRGHYSEYEIVAGAENGSKSDPFNGDDGGLNQTRFKAEKGSKKRRKTGLNAPAPTNRSKITATNSGEDAATAAVFDFLREVGIGEPKRTEISKLTLDLPDAEAVRLIRAVVERWNDTGKGKGLLVRLLEEAIPARIAQYRKVEMSKAAEHRVECAMGAMTPAEFADHRDRACAANPTAQHWRDATRDTAPDALLSLIRMNMRHCGSLTP